MKRATCALLSVIVILIVVVASLATIPTAQTGTWQAMGSMASARSGATAVLLQEDASAQQRIFNITNKSYPSNQTYFFRIELNDGTVIEFRYGLK